MNQKWKELVLWKVVGKEKLNSQFAPHLNNLRRNESRVNASAKERGEGRVATGCGKWGVEVGIQPDSPLKTLISFLKFDSPLKT